MKFRFKVYWISAVISLLLVLPLGLAAKMFTAGLTSKPDYSMRFTDWTAVITVGALGSFALLPLTALVSLVIAAALRLLGPESRPMPADRCGKCKYSLVGNTSGRCPECGTAVPHRK